MYPKTKLKLPSGTRSQPSKIGAISCPELYLMWISTSDCNCEPVDCALRPRAAGSASRNAQTTTVHRKNILMASPGGSDGRKCTNAAMHECTNEKGGSRVSASPFSRDLLILPLALR